MELIQHVDCATQHETHAHQTYFFAIILVLNIAKRFLGESFVVALHNSFLSEPRIDHF
jgi:hypothetical protein